MIIYQTKRHLFTFNGRRVVLTKQIINFNLQSLAMIVFSGFRQNS
jgi:hypothetical protein